jgi:uncharacterized protein (DUF427 family)
MPDLVIRLKHNNEILVSADKKHVQVLDNNYYIHPDLVDLSRLEISDRIYNCPSKGKARWVDLKTEQGWLNDICWVYPDPKKKYIKIAGWFGFYPSQKHYEIEK